MWYKDRPGHQDKRTTDNKGFTSRKTLTAQSKSVQMMGKLHLDLFCQEKYLLNHVDLKIKLGRSRDVFALMGDSDNYKINIKDLTLFVRNVQLSPAVRMGHVEALEKTSCKYPIRRVEVKVDTVPRGNMNYVQDNMFLGQLTNRLVIGCVDREEYAKGNTLFGFELTPDMSEVGTFQPIKQGNLRVTIHFAEALAGTINVVLSA